MSQENIELVRRGIEAFASGDWEAWLDAFDPAIEWVEMPSLGPDASAYRGIDEVRGAVTSWISNWTEYTFDVHRYIDAGDEVVVLVRESGRGRSTGAMVTRELGEILTLSDGKLSRLRMYGSWGEALEAAGLSEQTMSQENVEMLRQALETWASGDLRDLGDLSFLDRDVVYEDEILPDHVGETYHGREGFRRAWARAVEPWEALEGEVEWIRGAADNVVSCHHGRMRGKGSGIEASLRYAYLWRFRRGKVIYCRSYLDPNEALEAAGISE